MAIVDIVVPSYKGQNRESLQSLIQMIQATQCQCGNHAPWKCPKGKHSVWLPPNIAGSSVVHWARNQAIAYAMHCQPTRTDGRPPAEYFFLMDDDMLCHPEHLSRMLSYKLDIVSGIATIRRDPPRPNIRFWNAETETFKDPIKWDWFSNKLMEIDAVGAAYMLVKRSMLEKMGEAYLSCWFERQEDKRKFPFELLIDEYWDKKEKRRREVFASAVAEGDWGHTDCWWFQFLDNIVDSQHGELGEDLAFCWKAKKLGFKIYADPQVLPGHIGAYGYSIEDYRQFIEAEEGLGHLPEMRENVAGL